MVLFCVLLLLVASWAVGAYRRLKRLQASTLKSLGYLLEHWVLEMRSLQAFFPSDTISTHTIDQQSAAWRGLYAAIGQVLNYTHSIQATRKTPSKDDLLALRSARQVLLESWQRLEHSTADLAGSPIPTDMLQAWQRTETLTHDKLALYNSRATHYNHALQQIPASAVSRLYRMSTVETLI